MAIKHSGSSFFTEFTRGETGVVRRQQLSDFSALLLMDTLGVVSHSRLARL